MILLRPSTLNCTSSHALLEDWSKWLPVEKLPYLKSFEVFLRSRARTRQTTAHAGHTSLLYPLTSKRNQKKEKVLLLEGTKLKWKAQNSSS